MSETVNGAEAAVAASAPSTQPRILRALYLGYDRFLPGEEHQLAAAIRAGKTSDAHLAHFAQTAPPTLEGDWASLLPKAGTRTQRTAAASETSTAPSTGAPSTGETSTASTDTTSTGEASTNPTADSTGATAETSTSSKPRTGTGRKTAAKSAGRKTTAKNKPSDGSAS